MLINDFKVDINEQSKGGLTALMHAVYCRYWHKNNLDILKTLLQFDNIDLDCRNDQGETARDMAINRNRNSAKGSAYLDCVELIDQAAMQQSKQLVARPGF